MMQIVAYIYIYIYIIISRYNRAKLNGYHNCLLSYNIKPVQSWSTHYYMKFTVGDKITDCKQHSLFVPFSCRFVDSDDKCD